MIRFFVELLLLQFLLPTCWLQIVRANSLQVIGLTKYGLFRDLGPILSDSHNTTNIVSICPRDSYKTGFTIMCRMNSASYVHFRVDERWVRKEEVKPFYISGNCGEMGDFQTERVIYPWNSYRFGIVHLGCYGNNGQGINGSLNIMCGENETGNVNGNIQEEEVAIPGETPLQAIPPGIPHLPREPINATPTPKYVNSNRGDHESTNATTTNNSQNADDADGSIIEAIITVPDESKKSTDDPRGPPNVHNGWNANADVEVTVGKVSGGKIKADINIDEKPKPDFVPVIEAIPPGGKAAEDTNKDDNAAEIDISISVPMTDGAKAGVDIAANNCVTKKATDYTGGKPAQWRSSGTYGDSTDLKFTANSNSIDNGNGDENSSTYAKSEYYSQYALTYEFSVPVRSTYALIPNISISTSIHGGWISCSMGLSLRKGGEITKTMKPIKLMSARGIDNYSNSNNNSNSNSGYSYFCTLATAQVLEPGRNYSCKIAGVSTGTTFRGMTMFPCEGTTCRAESTVWQKYSSICKI